MTTFRLREMRERAGMGIAELARLVDVNLTDIAEMETEISVPTWTTAANIAIALGCSLDELAGIDAEKAE